MSTTKPGSLLKSLILVRTFTAWDEERSGVMEIDLVAHCGNTPEGQFLTTLTCTDVCTGWTDILGLPHRSQEAVCNAIHRLRLYINFFQPSLKLVAKEHIGNQTCKRYDPAKAPYQRVLDRKDISSPAKVRLRHLYLQLNPAELRRRIDQKTAQLWNISR